VITPSSPVLADGPEVGDPTPASRTTTRATTATRTTATGIATNLSRRRCCCFLACSAASRARAVPGFGSVGPPERDADPGTGTGRAFFDELIAP
jgi:hypothetical protein